MNIAILYYFFSMDTKISAKNSLFIIFFSQIASLLTAFLRNSIPDFDIGILILMVLGGICGALLGTKISKHFKEHHTEQFFVVLLCFIVGINIYNIVKFAMQI